MGDRKRGQTLQNVMIIGWDGYGRVYHSIIHVNLVKRVEGGREDDVCVHLRHLVQMCGIGFHLHDYVRKKATMFVNEDG